MREYQEIRDTSPLSLKLLNDQLRLLWYRVKNITTKDIRDDAVTPEKLEPTIRDYVSRVPEVIKELDEKLNKIDWESDYDKLNDIINSKLDKEEFGLYKIETDELIGTKVSNEEFQSYMVQTANLIGSKVSKDEFESYITQTAEAINSKVSNDEFSSYQQQIADLIASKVSSNDFESYRLQTAEQIASKVSKTDYNGNTIASYINQDATTITIKAERVDIASFVTADYVEALGITARRLTTLYNSYVLADLYRDSYGGVLEIYDRYENINIKLGVESGSGDNIGGTLVLYNDSYSRQRVEAGISYDADAGVLNLRNYLNTVTVQLYGGGSLGNGGALALRNSSGSQRILLNGNNGSISCYGNLDVGGDLYIGGSIDLSDITCESIYCYGDIDCDDIYCGDIDCSYIDCSRLYIGSGTYRYDGFEYNGRSARIQSDSTVFAVYDGSVVFAVKSTGSKVGGFVDKDNKRYYMSPIDSPRALLQDIILDVELTGQEQVIYLNQEFANIIDGYAIATVGNVKILEKHKDYFVVIGEGIADFTIIGIRYDLKDTYWFNEDAQIIEKASTVIENDKNVNIKTREKIRKVENTVQNSIDELEVINITLSGQEVE